MRHVSDKICRENQNTHFMFSNSSHQNCAVRDKVEKYGRTKQLEYRSLKAIVAQPQKATFGVNTKIELTKQTDW